jgi:hypothetical protein
MKAASLEEIGGLLGWIAPRVATGVLFIVAAYSLVLIVTSPGLSGAIGIDFGIYRDAAARWLHGGFFYYPGQVAGPYYTVSGHVMYPPPMLLLFVPFTILPAVLWWAIPLGIVAWRVRALRPSPWGWAGIAACLIWPLSVDLVWTGNPILWIVAAMALATRWRWVSALVFANPSLFPFAFFGVRTRRWWLALGTSALLSVLFLPMWLDWIRVILNARGPFSGPFYNLKDVPLMLVPLVAWASGARRPSGRSRTGESAEVRAYAVTDH